MSAYDPFFPDGLPKSDRLDAFDMASSGGGGGAGLPAVRQGFSWPSETKPAGAVSARPLARSAAPDPAALFRALGKHWVLALTLGFSCAAIAGAAAWWILPEPKYTATALIEVKCQKPILLLETVQERTDYKIFQSTQLALVRSRLVLTAALGRPGVADLAMLQARPKPIDWLEEAIEVDFPSGSELMSISLSGQSGPGVAAVVNAVTDAYLEEIVTKDHTERLTSAAKLNEFLDEYNEKLAKKRANLKKMAETVGSDDKQTLALKQQFATQELAQEKAELLRVQTELKRARSEIKVLQAVAAEQEGRSVDEAAVDEALSLDPTLVAFRAREDEIRRRLDRARRIVRNTADPSVRESQRQLEALSFQMRERVAILRPRIEKQLAARDETGVRLAELTTQERILADEEVELRKAIDRLDAEGQTFNRQTIDLQWLKDEITQGEETARRIGREIEALNVELKAPQRVRIIERGDNPRLESQKKRVAALAMVILATFGGTVLAVSWREYRLRKVGSPWEVSDGLGLRLVGALPAMPNAGRGRGQGGTADAARWQSLLVESVDAARAVLLREFPDNCPCSVMITSAAKGEGKSSLSSHLAISLSRTGRRTLLADFDLRNPSVHKLFDLPVGPGIAELLRREADPGDVAMPVTSELDVMTAGDVDALAIRALGQDTLPQLLGLLKQTYDLIVIDSAPVLPVADSLLIGQHADAVLLSVYNGVSRLPAVHACHAKLADLGVRVAGVVVTGIPASHYGEEYHYESSPVTAYHNGM